MRHTLTRYFTAKLGPILMKNSLNLLLISVPSEIIVPSLNLNLSCIFLVIFLFAICFIICHDFFISSLWEFIRSVKCCFSAHFKMIFNLFRYLLYVFSLATVLHFMYFLYNLFLVLMASFNPWVSHNSRVLYFMLIFCFGKCLLYTFSSTRLRRRLTGIKIHIMQIKRFQDRLIFIAEIPIPGKTITVLKRDHDCYYSNTEHTTRRCRSHPWWKSLRH